MPLAIRRVLLIDGTGAKLERATVVVDGDRIVAVGPDSRVKIPRGSRVIEGQGRALLPGLIDCHVHYCLDAGPDVIRTLEQDDPTVTALKAVTPPRATLDAGDLPWRGAIHAGRAAGRRGGSHPRRPARRGPRARRRRHEERPPRRCPLHRARDLAG